MTTAAAVVLQENPHLHHVQQLEKLKSKYSNVLKERSCILKYHQVLESSKVGNFGEPKLDLPSSRVGNALRLPPGYVGPPIPIKKPENSSSPVAAAPPKPPYVNPNIIVNKQLYDLSAEHFMDRSQSLIRRNDEMNNRLEDIRFRQERQSYFDVSKYPELVHILDEQKVILTDQLHQKYQILEDARHSATTCKSKSHKLNDLYYSSVYGMRATEEEVNKNKKSLKNFGATRKKLNRIDNDINLHVTKMKYGPSAIAKDFTGDPAELIAEFRGENNNNEEDDDYWATTSEFPRAHPKSLYKPPLPMTATARLLKLNLAAKQEFREKSSDNPEILQLRAKIRDREDEDHHRMLPPLLPSSIIRKAPSIFLTRPPPTTTMVSPPVSPSKIIPKDRTSYGLRSIVGKVSNGKISSLLPANYCRTYRVLEYDSSPLIESEFPKLKLAVSQGLLGSTPLAQVVFDYLCSLEDSSSSSSVSSIFERMDLMFESVPYYPLQLDILFQATSVLNLVISKSDPAAATTIQFLSSLLAIDYTPLQNRVFKLLAILLDRHRNVKEINTLVVDMAISQLNSSSSSEDNNDTSASDDILQILSSVNLGHRKGDRYGSILSFLQSTTTKHHMTKALLGLSCVAKRAIEESEHKRKRGGGLKPPPDTHGRPPSWMPQDGSDIRFALQLWQQGEKNKKFWGAMVTLISTLCKVSTFYSQYVERMGLDPFDDLILENPTSTTIRLRCLEILSLLDVDPARSSNIIISNFAPAAEELDDEEFASLCCALEISVSKYQPKQLSNQILSDLINGLERKSAPIVVYSVSIIISSLIQSSSIVDIQDRLISLNAVEAIVECLLADINYDDLTLIAVLNALARVVYKRRTTAGQRIPLATVSSLVRILRTHEDKANVLLYCVNCLKCCLTSNKHLATAITPQDRELFEYCNEFAKDTSNNKLLIEVNNLLKELDKLTTNRG